MISLPSATALARIVTSSRRRRIRRCVNRQLGDWGNVRSDPSRRCLRRHDLHAGRHRRGSCQTRRPDNADSIGPPNSWRISVVTGNSALPLRHGNPVGSSDKSKPGAGGVTVRR